MNRKIRVLVVDDSSLKRELIKAVLNADPDIEVVGTAVNGREGVARAGALQPDVVTMDLQMPVMGGFEAIDEIMQRFPVPIVVLSTMNADVIVRSLTVGAMDFVVFDQHIEDIAAELCEKVRIAARVRPIRRMRIPQPKPGPAAAKTDSFKVVAIGVSTGGPHALQRLLCGIPPGFPAGILVVQHIVTGLINGVALWLGESTGLDVRVAAEGETLKPGAVLLAPDNCHLGITRAGIIRLSRNSDENRVHVPSIDALMESVADSYGGNAVGVIMTGMGVDGVDGMRRIRAAGGRTIAQDESTSAVFGMNRAAIDKGFVETVVPLDRIADEIVRAIRA